MFKKWLRTWLLEDDQLKGNNRAYPKNEVYATTANSSIDEDNTIKFNVTPARGGIIVSVRHYDRRNDQTSYTNHVIHDDQNVAESISHIVSMELLKS